jgi:hypothetical protein
MECMNSPSPTGQAGKGQAAAFFRAKAIDSGN